MRQFENLRVENLILFKLKGENEDKKALIDVRVC